jgi:hypothetical protein
MSEGKGMQVLLRLGAYAVNQKGDVPITLNAALLG